MKSIIAYLAIPLILFLLLTACASPQLQPTEEKTAPMESTIEDINQFENKMENARNEQLDILSPTWFSKAESSFGKAKSKAEEGKMLADIREELADANEYLRNAEETAKVARTMLPEVIDSRRLAVAAGAPKLEKEYNEVNGQFLKLTEAIEKNNINYTKKNASKVNQAFLDLELLAIKYETIGEARQIVEEVEKNGGKKHAPQALDDAYRHLKETDAFITDNRYATEEMQDKAVDAMFYAKRARVMTDQNKKLEKMTPEETSLWIEELVGKVIAKLMARDSRDQDMNTQVENVLDSIGELQDNNKKITQQLMSTQNELAETKTDYDAQIQSLNQEIQGLNVALASFESKTVQDQKTQERILEEQKAIEKKLEDERQFNQKFIKIQNSFGPDEAEVYKQGNQLIIRLKGIKFPVGQAVIMPENYQLLSKVQRAINEFEGPSAVIEGHTDSTGSKEINDTLSQQRADAVMNYLISNETIPANKVVAQGYGSEKPVASNATPEGRAANRRIDVIVTPGLKPDQS
jgi:OOP family OmpA-OmpF porin